jgi:hypothetical protein
MFVHDGGVAAVPCFRAGYEDGPSVCGATGPVAARVPITREFSESRRFLTRFSKVDHFAPEWRALPQQRGSLPYNS